MWWFVFGGVCIFSGLILLYRSYPKEDRGLSFFLLDFVQLLLNMVVLTIQFGASFFGGGGSSDGGGSSSEW